MRDISSDAGTASPESRLSIAECHETDCGSTDRMPKAAELDGSAFDPFSSLLLTATSSNAPSFSAHVLTYPPRWQ
jgi:hypothetical protein